MYIKMVRNVVALLTSGGNAVYLPFKSSKSILEKQILLYIAANMQNYSNCRELGFKETTYQKEKLCDSDK